MPCAFRRLWSQLWAGGWRLAIVMFHWSRRVLGLSCAQSPLVSPLTQDAVAVLFLVQSVPPPKAQRHLVPSPATPLLRNSVCSSVPRPPSATLSRRSRALALPHARRRLPPHPPAAPAVFMPPQWWCLHPARQPGFLRRTGSVRVSPQVRASLHHPPRLPALPHSCLSTKRLAPCTRFRRLALSGPRPRRAAAGWLDVASSARTRWCLPPPPPARADASARVRVPAGRSGVAHTDRISWGGRGGGGWWARWGGGLPGSPSVMSMFLPKWLRAGGSFARRSHSAADGGPGAWPRCASA